MKRQTMGRMARRGGAALLAVGLFLTLAACGGQSEPVVLPGEYPVRVETLPALSQLVALEETAVFTEETPEDSTAASDGENPAPDENADAAASQDAADTTAASDGAATEPLPTTYHYTGLTSGAQTAQEYVQALVDDYGCTVVDSGNRTVETPSFSGESGQVWVAKESVGNDGLLTLDVQWEADGCSVTPQFAEGAEILPPPAEPLPASITLADAIETVKNTPMDRLGLPGSMEQYSLFAEEGVVLVNDVACYKIDVYLAETHQIAATYMVTSDGAHLYRLDSATGMAVELPAS